MSDSEDGTTQPTGTEEKTDEKKDQPAEPVKRARRAIPKFEASMLQDPEKGLAGLYSYFERMPDSSFAGDKECLASFMRKYQHWLYRLFPNDFGDMCWKIGDVKGVKNIVRDFVFDLKGRQRLANVEQFSSSDDQDHDQGQEQQPHEQQTGPSRDFLSDDDEDDYPIAGILDRELPERKEEE